MDKNKHIVISLGGSLIVPDEIDTEFVSSFVSMIREYVSSGFKFLVITGGGKLCRKYNDSIRSIVNPSDQDLDMMGIAATRINAEFVRICFGDISYEKVVLDPDVIPATEKSVIIGCGWKPGNSSDLAAVHGAQSIGSDRIINLSNINFVYDKDPKNNPDAKPLTEMSFGGFRNLLPKEWSPGVNAPFDPVAAAKAEALGYEVVILNGKNIENLKNYLDGEKFVGTVIK